MELTFPAPLRALRVRVCGSRGDLGAGAPAAPSAWSRPWARRTARPLPGWGQVVRSARSLAV